MKQHTIKITATGTKEELINFLKTNCVGLLQTSKNLEEKDLDFGNISGSMSKDQMYFTVRTLNDKAMATKMTDTERVKLTIIENFIDWYTTDEEERMTMKQSAEQYVEEDHVDEILQSFPELNL